MPETKGLGRKEGGGPVHSGPCRGLSGPQLPALQMVEDAPCRHLRAFPLFLLCILIVKI